MSFLHPSQPHLPCSALLPSLSSPFHSFISSLTMAFELYDGPSYTGAVITVDNTTQRQTLRHELAVCLTINYETFRLTRTFNQAAYALTVVANLQSILPARRARLLEFATTACMNEPSEDRLELIQQSTFFLYLYVPEDVARGCLESQSLAPIPDYLRIPDGQDHKLLAMKTKPYGYTSVQAIVQKYHNAGCYGVSNADIDFFIAVPKTSWFDNTEDPDVFTRSGRFGPFDIVAIGRSMLSEQED
ncbi:hypothetical protein FS317_45255 [Microvirga sp. M8]|nr:hypothetical protein [Microvirga tunisiensis]